MKSILIIGATSAMAISTARLLAEKKQCRFFLVARNLERLQSVRDDLKVRGAEDCHVDAMDINDLDSHNKVLANAGEFLGRIDLALIAHGTLPDQSACESDTAKLHQEFATNAGSTIHLLNLLGNIFEKQQHGSIAVISSVAGDRGRQSNYLYGAAKAAVSTYLSGLRNRLFKHKVQVLDIKPGFVDTPMTADFPKSPLWAQPEDIAKGIISGVEKGRDVVYLPFFWRYIMLVIRWIPEKLFKRLSL